MKKFVCLACASLFLLGGCNTRKAAVEPMEATADSALVWGYKTSRNVAVLPPVIVYKTRKDYNNFVPVTLDMTGTQVVSYPAPSDLRRGNGYAVPTELEDGYLLDNRGIGIHTAFTSYTYEEYAAMDAAPSIEEILAHIVDKDPIVEMWNCGLANRYNDKVTELNRLVATGFPGCKMLVGRNTQGD